MNSRHFLLNCNPFWWSGDFLDTIGPSRSVCYGRNLKFLTQNQIRGIFAFSISKHQIQIQHTFPPNPNFYHLYLYWLINISLNLDEKRSQCFWTVFWNFRYSVLICCASCVISKVYRTIQRNCPKRWALILTDFGGCMLMNSRGGPV